jgi:hypothetical protein
MCSAAHFAGAAVSTVRNIDGKQVVFCSSSAMYQGSSPSSNVISFSLYKHAVMVLKNGQDGTANALVPYMAPITPGFRWNCNTVAVIVHLQS